MRKKAMNYVAQVTKQELSTEKVELAILDDIQKQINVLSKGLADMQKKSSAQLKALDNASSAISKLKRANLDASRSSVQNETNKTLNLMARAEEAAKELGMNPNNVKGLRELEKLLDDMKCTMVIISHDRHFLNSVCTHMADIDYGELRLYPGNYDEYMTAATQARERLLSENAKKKAQLSELQEFVSRFSANASKAKQATSRAKQMDKIQLDEVKASSRVNPYIVFKQEKKLFRNALETVAMTKSFDNTLFKDLNLMIEVGERVAIIGQNGVGKTTLLRTLMGEIELSSGEYKWSENAQLGYYAQDHSSDFEKDQNLMDWMGQWMQEGDDEQVVRGTLGRLLFGANDITKSVKIISGGEQGRMLFGKLMMNKPNILLMDEPTNHLDMESIESLNLALENYEGTLLFVSHDREFVSSLATRIIEIKENEVVDFHGTYEEYLKSQGVGE